jgi:hypothetical protein
VPARSLRVRFQASRSAVSHKLQQEKIEEICAYCNTQLRRPNDDFSLKLYLSQPQHTRLIRGSDESSVDSTLFLSSFLAGTILWRGSANKDSKLIHKVITTKHVFLECISFGFIERSL